MSIYICELCSNLMDNAQQLLCGCRFCLFCIKNYSSNNNQSCPSCNSSNIQTIFSDKAFQRVINQLQTCPLNCGSNDNVKKHVKTCSKRTSIDKHIIFLIERIKQLNSEVQQLNDKNNDITQEINTLKVKNEVMKHQLNTVKSQPQLSNIPGSNITLKENKISVSNGIATWTIPNITSKIIIQKMSSFILSDEFYLVPHGYCFRLKIYLGGDGVGYGNSISIYFAICNGINDNSLIWPFDRRVALSMLSNTGKNDKVDKFKTNQVSDCYVKPISDTNLASGSPRFMTHSELLYSAIYIVDDAIRIAFKQY